jgi:hypothetical protein
MGSGHPRMPGVFDTFRGNPPVLNFLRIPGKYAKKRKIF